MQGYTVKEITRDDTKPFLLNIHYARRMPGISYAFGLFDPAGELVGVITYGTSANRYNNSLGGFKMVELTRLCLKFPLKNGASYLISQSFKLLPKPLALISYADTGANHVGYIYQATNWLYTGISKGMREFTIEGKRMHQKAVSDRFGTCSWKLIKERFPDAEVRRLGDKYRYYYFLGDKRQKKSMHEALAERHQISKYPKAVAVI